MYNLILELSWRKSWVALFIFVVLSVSSVHAQAWNHNAGHFDTDTPSAPSNVRVHYDLSQTGNCVSLQANVDTPFTVNMHVVDANGNEISNIETQNIAPRFGFGRNLDISGLSSGTYFVEFLYGENNQRKYRLQFIRE
jgi:hypothetical protein